jgi:ketosteroid isomerase-like protein
MSLRDNVNELNRMILQGEILDAFDKFYAEDVVMQEDSDEPRRGKAANREYEEQFVASLEQFHDAEIRAVALDEENGVAMIEWFMDVTVAGQGRTQMEQIAVQRWEDGQVVHERFYHA